MSTVNVTEARASLPDLLDRVARGEEVTITRHGRPVAIVVRPDTLRVRRGTAAIERAEELGRALDRARRSRMPVVPALTPARAEELIAEVRAARRRRR